MNQRRVFVLAVIQTVVIVGIVALQDPEVRRNVAWALEWTRDRALDFLHGPDLPHASHREIAAVIDRAEEIAAEAAPKGEA